jgi:NAD(P)-dependent dehydrogenase (short-subunit alcohol dehydrogenase family)
MELELTGKRAIVTGGSRGIGKAIARELALEGVDVVIAARDKATLDAAAAELAAETGRRIIPIVADTTKWDDVQNMVDSTVAALGGVDILVNSAAMVGGQVRGTLAEATETDLIEDLDTKVVGYFRCIKAVVPHMQSNKWGRIISIGGVSARQSTIYGLRNAAVVHMTKTFSDQLGPDGITLNVVHPGTTRTSAVESLMNERAQRQGTTTEALEQASAQSIAIRRIIEPKELGYVVTFLASPKAESITGEVIAAGGGAPGAVFQ